MMRGEELSERLIDFSVRAIKLCGALPKSYTGRHIANQLVSSGPSAGANYEEARGAESNADFLHKLGVALKELRESLYWLKVIQRSEMLPSNRMRRILQEADELCAILVTSIKTAKKKRMVKKE